MSDTFSLLGLSVVGRNAAEVGCFLLVFQSMGPCLPSVSYHRAGHLVTVVFFMMKHVGKNTFGAVQIIAFFQLLLANFKDPLMDLFSIKYRYIVCLVEIPPTILPRSFFFFFFM